MPDTLPDVDKPPARLCPLIEEDEDEGKASYILPEGWIAGRGTFRLTGGASWREQTIPFVLKTCDQPLTFE